MNSKKRRVTRKRCVRKCKKQTSRKLRGSRRYRGGMKGGSSSVPRINTRYVNSTNPYNPVRSTISKRWDREVHDKKRIEEARRQKTTDLTQKDNAVLSKQPLVNDTPTRPHQ